MKRFFSLMLIALVSCAMMVSCDKEENTTNNNQGGNGGNGGNQTVNGVTVKFGNATWTAGFGNYYWVSDYDQIFVELYKNAEVGTMDEPTQDVIFPATDAWIYPDANAEQDYFVNYYESTALDVSEQFSEEAGTVIVGDYFWYPELPNMGEMTLANVNFDASTLNVRDMVVTVPLVKTTNYMQNQDATAYNETLTFHNVQLVEPQQSKGLKKVRIQK